MPLFSGVVHLRLPQQLSVHGEFLVCQLIIPPQVLFRDVRNFVLRVNHNIELGGGFLDDIPLRCAEKNLRSLRKQVYGTRIACGNLFLVVEFRLLFAELLRPGGLILLRPGGKTLERSAEIIGQPLENQFPGSIEQIAVWAVLSTRASSRAWRTI